jgi:hypothetical protein
VAVTANLIVDPTSPSAICWELPVADAMSLHAAPVASQRRHWNPNVGGSSLAHVPGLPTSVSPGRALPVMLGGAVFAGPPLTTGAVAADVAAADPTRFDPVTATSRVMPRSAVTRVYAVAVAPLTAEQFVAV